MCKSKVLLKNQLLPWAQFFLIIVKIALTRQVFFVGGAGVKEAQENRDFVVKKVNDEIHEIMRVLQLTTYDEDEWDADDITIMKKAAVRTTRITTIL